MDTFRVVLLVKLGESGPIVKALLGSGYPVQRATSTADAVRLMGLGPCFVFADSQSAAQISAIQVASLEPMVHAGTVRICLIDELPTSAPISPLVTTLLSPELSPEELLDELSRMLWMNRSTAPQAEVAFRAVFTTPDGTGYNGTLSALGHFGASFVAQDAPPVGAMGRLAVFDTSGEQLLEIDAEVVSKIESKRLRQLKFVVTPDAPMQRIRHIVARAAGVGSRIVEGVNVVVFDESWLVRQLMTVALTRAGYAVTSCETMPELMRSLPSAAILLLDPSASVLSLERLKEIGKRAAKSKVVFLTGADEALVKKAQEATGVQHVIRKGSFNDVLVARIAEISARG